VDAVIYYKVVDATRAIVEVEDFEAATLLLAQTTLRDLLGQNELDTILPDSGDGDYETRLLAREYAARYRPAGGGGEGEESPYNFDGRRVSGLQEDE
jgi:regulator of protease activity HflC (stomatin/prohibitin superfamily)